MPTPPSFSSFPPSFGSFPDVEDNHVREASSASSQPKGLREKDEASDRKKKKRDRRGEHANQSQTFNKRERRNHDPKADSYAFDDERIKAEESLSRKAKQHDVPQLAFFSDRKGDPLNVQYGGIHSKEVPKYHLVGRA